MILKRIVEFAELHRDEIPISGYQNRFITKVIQLDSNGVLIGVISPSGEKKGKREGKTWSVPQESPMRTAAVSARLIADNVSYVLGIVTKSAIEKDTAKGKKGEAEKRAAACHKAWEDLISKAATETKNPALIAIKVWIDSNGPKLTQVAEAFEDDDEITFQVNGSFPTEDSQIQDWWASQDAEYITGQCLITGLEGPVTERMPSPIKNLPDGQSSGNALVTVNFSAGESYGNSAALNSPISVSAAEKLCNGLNLLVNGGKKEEVKEKGKKKTTYKYALRVGKVIYLAWCKTNDENFWSILDAPDPKDVQELLNQPLSGKGQTEVSENDFFVLALSANGARIIVRESQETTLAKAKTNIARWYRRLELIGLDGGPMPPQGIYKLAASLYRDASKEMPAQVPTDLLHSALFGYPLPKSLLALAVKRNLAMQGPFELNSSKKKYLCQNRLALIKAVLTTNPENSSLKELNTHQPPAYHCGRLLAVLDSIQRIAIPGLNTTLVDRNYGAACSSPASIFGNLLKDATSAHLPKLRKTGGGAFIALDKRLQEIILEIGDSFPKTLTLEEQGLFSLGFYHQRAADFAAAKNNKELKPLAEAEETTE